jgi:outer membrane protein TolC
MAFLLAIAIHVDAQNLPTLIDMANENNLGLKVSQGEYESSVERAVQVSTLPNPEFGIGYFPLPVETRLGAQIVRFSASQKFPWFGSLDSRSKVESSKSLALNERTNTAELQLSYGVKVAYFKLYELERKKAIIGRNIVVLSALERLAVSKLESGLASASDVLRVQIKIVELEQDLALIETSRINPQVELNQMLNRDLETEVVVRDSLKLAILEFDKDSLRENIVVNHPLLRMYELQQEVSRNINALSDIDSKPTFGIGLDYILVNERTDATPDRNGRDIVQIKATVSIPLDGRKYSAVRREQELQIDVLNNKRADALLLFAAGIEKAFAEYDDAKLRHDLFIRQKQLTQSAINIIEADYSAKGQKFDELLVLQTELIQYDLKILSAIVKSHMAKAAIELYIVN